MPAAQLMGLGLQSMVWSLKEILNDKVAQNADLKTTVWMKANHILASHTFDSICFEFGAKVSLFQFFLYYKLYFNKIVCLQHQKHKDCLPRTAADWLTFNLDTYIHPDPKSLSQAQSEKVLQHPHSAFPNTCLKEKNLPALQRLNLLVGHRQSQSIYRFSDNRSENVLSLCSNYLNNYKLAWYSSCFCLSIAELDSKKSLVSVLS